MSEQTEVKEAIDKLREAEIKLASKSQTFYRGMLYGLGFFVGGTLLVGVTIYIFSFFNTAPVIGGYISKILHVVNPTK